MSGSLRKAFVWMLVLLVTALAAACGGGGGSSDGAATGTLQVALTDAVNPAFEKVMVCVEEIRAVQLGKEDGDDNGHPLIAAFDPPRCVNVLDLAFQQEVLGEATVPAGTYNQIRLKLVSNDGPGDPPNHLVMQGAPESLIPLKTPSGQQSGLKILGRFTVAPGELTAIVLDFDPSRAIVQAGSSGNWNFKPTGIRLVEVKDLLLSYGAIVGTVIEDPASGGAGAGAPVATAVVSAVPEGGSAAIASGQVNTEDGSFRAFLPPGFYEVRASAEGYDPFSSAPVLYEVIEGQDTDAGTIELTPAATTP